MTLAIGYWAHIKLFKPFSNMLKMSSVMTTLTPYNSLLNRHFINTKETNKTILLINYKFVPFFPFAFSDAYGFAIDIGSKQTAQLYNDLVHSGH